jgi:Rap1a immunity proteins
LRVCSDERQFRDREDTVDLAVRSIGCSGYLKGIIDSEAYMSSTVLKGRCLPEDVTYGQAEAIFLKYLRDHPEKLHLHLPGLFLDAMKEAFPCSKQP